MMSFGAAPVSGSARTAPWKNIKVAISRTRKVMEISMLWGMPNPQTQQQLKQG
jgi:hypothetical protein